MVRPRALRFAPALLLAALALSFSADSAQAWWRHWGCHFWHAPVYRPVVYAPVYGATSYSCWPRVHQYQYPCYSTYSYAVPSYYLPTYYPSSDCCGGLAPQYRWIVPADEMLPADAVGPTPADMPPALPEPPLPQPRFDAGAPSGDLPPAPPPGDAGLPAPPPPADAGLPAPPAPEPAGVTTPQPDSVIPADPAPALPLLPGGGTFQPADGTILTVDVPADARVHVNGMLTKTPGTQRQYLSRGLEPGRRYTYEVRAEWSRGGRPISRTELVEVRAGESASIAFDPPAPSSVVASGAETLLRLRVPADARVTLEGQTTRATGRQRVFLTRELAPGQVWEGYRIAVQLERNGAVETREETLDLVGGKRHELSFDFGPPQVALR